MAQYPKMMGSHVTGVLNRKNDVVPLDVCVLPLVPHQKGHLWAEFFFQVQSGAKTVHLGGHQLESYHLAGAPQVTWATNHAGPSIDRYLRAGEGVAAGQKEGNSTMSTKTIKHVCAVWIPGRVYPCLSTVLQKVMPPMAFKLPIIPHGMIQQRHLQDNQHIIDSLDKRPLGWVAVDPFRWSMLLMRVFPGFGTLHGGSHRRNLFTVWSNSN